MDKVMVAMSGGVDSSVAAHLLKEEGYVCSGAMMKLFGKDGGQNESEADARAAAVQLGMPFHIFDMSDAFEAHVIHRFAAAYSSGATPNPCVDCNRHIKFGLFVDKSREMGCGCIATGHYARIGNDNGRYLLKKGMDLSKDQSYVLYSMTQEQLSRTQFPLGGLTKREVREYAGGKGLLNAGKRESQDICFVPDGDYAGFIEDFCGVKMKRGRFKDTDGNDLGEHSGILRYTIGQRKGLGISGVGPLYVCAICPESNTVVVGAAGKVYSNTLVASGINLIAADRLDAPLRVAAKIRYRQREQPATVRQLDADTLMVEFDQPQRAITKGQAVVLYDGDTVIGGGTIT